jgi:hypothetical protein
MSRQTMDYDELFYHHDEFKENINQTCNGLEAFIRAAANRINDSTNWSKEYRDELARSIHKALDTLISLQDLQK